MLKKIAPYYGIWLLLCINLYVLYYYFQEPDSIHTIIALFWVQSVLIGLFNAIDLFTIRNAVPDSFTINDTPGNRQGCAGLFFVFHFGFFHAMYLLFLIPGILDLQKLDWRFLRLAFWLLIATLSIEFIQNKIRNKTEPVNISAMFFMPYIRIVPMHILILSPTFLKMAPPLIFILLKTVADIITYKLYQKAVYKPANQIKTD